MPLAIDRNELYSYADYLSWDDDQRWELIEGVPYLMTPAPLEKHQAVSGVLYGELYQYFKDKPCSVYHAPFDVRFNKDKDDSKIDTVVQPDIAVICNKNKIDRRGAVGAPDLIMEILSPSTSHRDQSIKYNLYEKQGVREYWIVDPGNRFIQVSTLENDSYADAGLYEENQIARSVIFPDFSIPLDLVFQKKL